MIMQSMRMIMQLMRMMTNYEILAPLNWRPSTFKPSVCQHWGGPASLDGNIKQVAIISCSGHWSLVAFIQNLNVPVRYCWTLNFDRIPTSAKLVRLALATVRWSVGNGCDGRRRCTSLRWSWWSRLGWCWWLWWCHLSSCMICKALGIIPWWGSSGSSSSFSSSPSTIK